MHTGNAVSDYLRHIIYIRIARLLTYVAVVSIVVGMVFLSEPHIARIGFLTTFSVGLLFIVLGMLSIGGIFWLKGTCRI